MKKKLNSLKSLIRLHQHNLDALRRRLAEEEEDLRKTLALISEIDQSIIHEKSFAHLSPDFMQAFTSFLQGAKYRRALQDYKRKEIESQIEITRDLLREALAELKRYELARDKLLRIRKAEETKREQKEMDDVGLRSFFVK